MISQVSRLNKYFMFSNTHNITQYRIYLLYDILLKQRSQYLKNLQMHRGVSQIRKNTINHGRERSQDSKLVNKHEQKCISKHRDQQPERTKSPLKKFLQLRLGKHYSTQLKDMMQLLQKQKKLRIIMESTSDPIKRDEIQSMINFLKNQEENLIKNTGCNQLNQQNSKQQNLLVQLNKQIHGKNSKLVNQQQICQQIRRSFANQSRTLQIIFNQLEQLCKQSCKLDQDNNNISFAELLSKLRRKIEVNKKGKEQQLMKKILELEKNNVRLTKQCHKIEEEFEYLVQEKLLLQSKLDRAKIMVKANQTQKSQISNKYLANLSNIKKDIQNLKNYHDELKRSISTQYNNLFCVWKNNFEDLITAKNNYSNNSMKHTLQKQQEQMRHKIAEKQKQVLELLMKIQQKQHQLSIVNQQCCNVKQRLEEFRKQKQQQLLREQIQSQELVTSFKQQNQMLKQQLEKLQIESHKQNQFLSQEINKMQQINKQLQHKLQQMFNQLQETQNKNNMLEEISKQMENKLKVITQKESQLKDHSQIIICKQQIETLKSELKQINEQNLQLRMEIQNKNNQIYILEQQNSNQQHRLQQMLQQREQLGDLYQKTVLQKNQLVQSLKCITQQFQQRLEQQQQQHIKKMNQFEENCRASQQNFKQNIEKVFTSLNSNLFVLEKNYSQCMHQVQQKVHNISNKLYTCITDMQNKLNIYQSTFHKITKSLKQLKQIQNSTLQLTNILGQQNICSIKQQAIAELNQFLTFQQNKRQQVQQLPLHYTQALQSLFQEFLLNKVNLQWRNQLQQISPQKRQKITTYRNRIAQLQLRIRNSEETALNQNVTKSAVLNLGNKLQSKHLPVGTSLLPGIKSQNENSMQHTLEFSYIDIVIPAQILQLSGIESTQTLLLRQIEQLKQQNEQLRSELQNTQQEQIIFDF